MCSQEPTRCRTYVVGAPEHQESADDDLVWLLHAGDAVVAAVWRLFVRTAAPRRIEAIRQALQRHMPGRPICATFTDGSDRRSNRGPARRYSRRSANPLIRRDQLYRVAYNVTQRTHEMGVRVALGAQSGDVVRLVVREGLVLVASGIVIGAIAALAAGKWVRPLLFEVSPSDPLVFAVVVGLLLLVAIVASWIPARRASRIDPQLALRTE
jgi:hypothetical protein